MQLRLPAVVVCLCGSLLAQHRVDPRNMYERALCVVPMVGAGTPADPIRPQYAPLPPPPGMPLSRAGIIAFSYQMSDDGKLALVEFVALSRAAFKDLLADTNPAIKVFIKGNDKRADIEAAFQALKAGFNLDSLVTVVP